ncbi:MAG: bifunctional diaminohydroxyphosphoribosylaminopyrimidine deaminase/5-amino-6-(5-phosphoribosylamino)uracil reductase RibD [Candidatus Binatia bacterium]
MKRAAATADELFMRRALELAAKGCGRTSPNPAVGAVIVRGGRIIGEGFHRRAGLPHAEREALRNVAGDVRGATLYVNLEPCSHHGRTPPCADALIETGIKRVVIGMADPNPVVHGHGLRRLRNAGIEVQTGVLREDCERLNEDFSCFIRTGRPFVTVKLAASLDGRIASASGDARWISGEKSRRIVHVLRNRVDAIVVGIETVRADDPQLTCRIRGGRDPLRVILDSRLSIAPTARVCTQRSTAATLIATCGEVRQKDKKAQLEAQGVEVVAVEGEKGRISFAALLRLLGKRGLKSVLVEGGGQVAAAALREEVVDKVLFFYAPLLLGGDGRAMIGPLGIDRVAAACKLHTMEICQVGKDFLVSAYVRGKGK